MESGAELRPKCNSQPEDPIDTTPVNWTSLEEKASRLQSVLKKMFTARLRRNKGSHNFSGILFVLGIIQSSRAGVDAGTVGQITGYTKQKVDKILYKLFKNGEIMIEKGGLYAGVDKNCSIVVVT